MNIKELIERLRSMERITIAGGSLAGKAADALLAQQVCIKQKDAALQRCTKFTQEDYDALALQPDLTALREHDAEVVTQCYYVVRGAPLSVDGVALTALQVLSIYDQLTLPLRTMAERIYGE